MEVVRLAASQEILGSYLRRLMADTAYWRRSGGTSDQDSRGRASSASVLAVSENAQRKEQ